MNALATRMLMVFLFSLVAGIGVGQAWGRSAASASSPGTAAALAGVVERTDSILSVSIDTKPARYSNRAEGAIEFSSSQAATCTCSLDGAPYAPCVSPFRYASLANGLHIFSLKAVDGAGNSAPIASYSWYVNTSLAASSAVRLPRTGQTKCYDENGLNRACADSGQDGDVLAGVPWPEERFVDNGNGTVNDNLTGLVWLKNAECFGLLMWPDALASVSRLADGHCGLADGSKAGEWRLPCIAELESLVDLQYSDPPLMPTHPFVNIHAEEDYWSSSTCAATPGSPWYVYMSYGYVGKSWPQSNAFYVWPVRSASDAKGVVQLPWTGQERCVGDAGVPILCNGTGQDGETRNGAAWPVPRFTDNGDGTRTDNLTGLVWSTVSNPAGAMMNWQEAMQYIAGLNSGKWLGCNDWRLPNRKELLSLINREQPDSTEWLASQGFFFGQPDFPCWTSSSYAAQTLCAWWIDMRHGDAHGGHKLYCSNGVWPVRGGYVHQRLNISRSGPGSVVTDAGAPVWEDDVAMMRFEPGSLIRLVAKPDPGFAFAGWSGDCSGPAECSVVMNTAKSIGASFTALPAAEAPKFLRLLKKVTQNGRIALLSGLSETVGAVYVFQYSGDGGLTWITGYSGASRTSIVTLPQPGTYQFRVYVTAAGFAPSRVTAAEGSCAYRAVRK